MISDHVHELLKIQVDFLWHLEDCKKKAYKEFLDYSRRVDLERQSIKELRETLDNLSIKEFLRYHSNVDVENMCEEGVV